MGSDQSKWFSPKAVPGDPTGGLRLTTAGGVACHDAVRLMRTLTQAHRLSAETRHLFTSLCKMQPAVRLARNLKIVLGILALQPITNLIPEGLQDSEQAALLELEHVGIPAEDKSIAQGLLNLYERQQLVLAGRMMFHGERVRKWQFWELDGSQTQDSAGSSI